MGRLAHPAAGVDLGGALAQVSFRLMQGLGICPSRLKKEQSEGQPAGRPSRHLIRMSLVRQTSKPALAPDSHSTSVESYRQHLVPMTADRLRLNSTAERYPKASIRQASSETRVQLQRGQPGTVSHGTLVMNQETGSAHDET